MAHPARLLLGLLLLALGLWTWIMPTMSSLPLPASTYLLRAFLQALFGGILIALGLVVLFPGRILRIASPAKEKAQE